jgi:hypothetical protein
MESLDELPKTGNVDAMDLVPCLGLWCCFLSCYTEFPDCLGTVGESICLCFSIKSLACKTAKEEGTCCKCYSCECDIIPCNVCCKVRADSVLLVQLCANDMLTFCLFVCLFVSTVTNTVMLCWCTSFSSSLWSSSMLVYSFVYYGKKDKV